MRLKLMLMDKSGVNGNRENYLTKKVLIKNALFIILLFANFLSGNLYAYSEGHKLKKLMLGVNIGDMELGKWLNEHLEEGDSVQIWSGKYKNLTFVTNRKLIRSITEGNYKKIIDSLEDLKRNKIKVVIYDIEQGGKNITRDEISNPVKYTKLLKNFCEQNNFILALAPGKRIIKKIGAELARYADQFLFMTGAAQEKSPEKFRKEMIKRIKPVKLSNPGVKIIVQLRTFHQKRGVRGKPFSASQLMNYVESIQDYADGIAVIYSKDTVDVMKEFVLRFKSKY